MRETLRTFGWPVLGLCILFCRSEARAEGGAPADKVPPAVYHRTAFLGDSITDGNTYPQLVRDALAAAGLPHMVAINAGIGGDTAHGMRARLERDVLAFRPTLVTLSCGANDALRGVSPAAYAADVRGIAERLRQAHVPLILLTPDVLGPARRPKGQKNLDAYERALRDVAGEYGLRVAEVNRRQAEDAAAGHPQLAPDDLHPNYQGQRMIARAVLDAMGYADAKVPVKVSNEPLPGLIPQWKLKRLDPKAPPLAAAAVAGLKPGDGWITLKLPDTQPIPDAASPDNHWLDDCRTLGAAVSLRQQPAGTYVGVATLHSDKARAVQFHTGAELEQLWLNGKLIYENKWDHGWHIGRESVPADLRAGDNHLVIRTGQVFFLSVTDGPMWEG